MVMSAKEKKAFVARMKKAKKDAAKGKTKPKKQKKQSSLSKTAAYHRKQLRKLGYSERTINKFLREHGKIK